MSNSLKLLCGIGLATMAIAQPAIGAAARSGEFTAKGPSGALVGTLVETGKKNPLVLIIPGSGPTDRDGNNPLGVTAATYRLLAEALAGKGISTLRIDKRGMFASKAATPDPSKVTIADYAADTASWISAVQAKSKRTCVWLLGHSEGGLIALTAAQQNKSVCGVILAATPGRKLAEIMRAQISGNPANAPIKDDALKAIASLEAGKPIDVSAMHPALQGLFNPAVQPFLIDLFSKDPLTLARGIGQPMLIVQGARDSQVTNQDAQALAAAQPRARLATFPAMTHTLKDSDNESLQANMATYGDPSRPLTSGAVEAVAAFVKERR